HDARAAVVADLLGGPLDHAMALARLGGHHLAGAGDLEALLGAGFGLHLGHLGHLLDRPETDARARITAMLAQDSAERLRRHGSPLAGRRKARLYGRSGPKWQPPEPLSRRLSTRHGRACPGHPRL